MSRAGMPLRSATSGAMSQTLSMSWSSVGASVASGISSDVPIQQCVSASWNTETTKVGPAPCGASGTMVVNTFMQWLPLACRAGSAGRYGYIRASDATPLIRSTSLARLVHGRLDRDVTGRRVPDAVQREAQRSEAPLLGKLDCVARNDAPLIRDRHATGLSRSLAVPVLQRTTPLRSVLRCARDTRAPPHRHRTCSKLLPPVPDCSTPPAGLLRPLMFRPRVISSRGYGFSSLPVGTQGRAAVWSRAAFRVGDLRLRPRRPGLCRGVRRRGPAGPSPGRGPAGLAVSLRHHLRGVACRAWPGPADVRA